MTTTARYRLAHRDDFNADWRNADAYHMGAGEPEDFDDLNDAIAAASSLDETCEWDVIVVKIDPKYPRNRPFVAWG